MPCLTPRADKTTLRMARTFIRTYGADRLRQLLGDFERGRRAVDIAAELDVSRERVRQWRNAFGARREVYMVHPEVAPFAAPEPVL